MRIVVEVLLTMYAECELLLWSVRNVGLFCAVIYIVFIARAECVGVCVVCDV